MPKESIWMSPDLFVKRFDSYPSLLGSVLNFTSIKTYKPAVTLTRDLQRGEYVSAQKLIHNCSVRWPMAIVGVALRDKYANHFEDVYSEGTYPLVDKKYNIVLRVHGVGCTEVITWLYRSHHIWSKESVNTQNPKLAYLLEGCGYYQLESMQKFLVGQILSRGDILDNHDKVIIAGRMAKVTEKSRLRALR